MENMNSMSTSAQKPKTTSTSPSKCQMPACLGCVCARRSKYLVEKVWRMARPNRTAPTPNFHFTVAQRRLRVGAARLEHRSRHTHNHAPHSGVALSRQCGHRTRRHHAQSPIRTTLVFTAPCADPWSRGLAGLWWPAAVCGTGGWGPVGTQHALVERGATGLWRGDSELCGSAALGLRHGAERPQHRRAHTLLCVECGAIADGLACDAVTPSGRGSAAGDRLCGAPGARPSAGRTHIAAGVVPAAALAPDNHGLRVPGRWRHGRQPLTIRWPSKKPAEAGFLSTVVSLNGNATGAPCADRLRGR